MALNPDDIAKFHQLLERLVSAGVPLPPALEQLGADLDGDLRELAQSLSRQLSGGRTLGEAMRDRDDIPRLYVEMIAAAEGSEDSGGALAEVLGHVARHAAAAARIRRQLSDALMYPLLLAAGALVLFYHVFTGLAVDVRAFGISLREGSGSILGAGGSLPVDSSSFAAAVLLGAVAVLVVTAFCVRTGRLPAGAYQLPLLGRALRAGEIAAVLRTLALLVGTGQRPERALALAAETTHWPALGQGAREAATGLSQGLPFASAMDRLAAVPGELRWLLVGAWQQGEDFPAAVTEVADAAEQDASDQARRSAVTMEVVVLGVAGLAVLAVGALTYVRLNTIVDYLSVGS